MRSSVKGFTLIEVLVAMAVFSVALLAIGQMQIVAARVNTAAGRLSRATAIVEQKIEQLMAAPYDDPLLNDPTPVGQSTAYTETNAIDGYTLIWQVDRDTPAVNVKTINLTATWQTNGRAKSFSLAFLKESI